jgi:membrane-associated protein
MNKKYLDKTHEIYEEHGVQTLILFQFAPIFRTFAPFVAGVGHMTYGKFARFNLVGVLLWTILCIGSGYFFGNLPWVNQHFEVVILGIVFVSLIPTFLQIAKAVIGSNKKTAHKKK